MQTSIRLDQNLLAVDGDHDVHAMLELSASEPPESAERLPLRLALVLDRSGSMAGGSSRSQSGARPGSRSQLAGRV
jgi:hypothetical protein